MFDQNYYCYFLKYDILLLLLLYFNNKKNKMKVIYFYYYLLCVNFEYIFKIYLNNSIHGYPLISADISKFTDIHLTNTRTGQVAGD